MTIQRSAICRATPSRPRATPVRTAADGAEALDLPDGWRPDLIVPDLMMPGVDGWAFRVRQQAREEWAHIPVIALTAGDFPPDCLEQLRAAHLLRKPFDPDKLLDGARAMAGPFNSDAPRPWPG